MKTLLTENNNCDVGFIAYNSQALYFFYIDPLTLTVKINTVTSLDNPFSPIPPELFYFNYEGKIHLFFMIIEKIVEFSTKILNNYLNKGSAVNSALLCIEDLIKIENNYTRIFLFSSNCSNLNFNNNEFNFKLFYNTKEEVKAFLPNLVKSNNKEQLYGYIKAIAN